MTRHQACRLLTLAFAASLLSSSLPAQEGNGDPSAFSDAIEIRVVNVDVVVVDKKGNPVLGLGPEDFRLLEDRTPVEIKYFQAPGDSPTETESPPIEPEAPTGNQVLLTSNVSNPMFSRLVVYIDNYGIKPGDRGRILEDIETFVSNQAGRSEIALATYNPGLEFLSPFTSDLAKFRQALARVPDLPAKGVEIDRELGRALSRIQTLWETFKDTPGCGDDPCNCAQYQFQAVWRDHANLVTNRVNTSGNGISELVRTLGTVPGNKVVLYAGSGLELRPGIDVLQYLIDLCPLQQQLFQADFLRFDETTTFDNIAASANTNRVTIHSLDASGIRADISTSTEWANRKFRPSTLFGQMRKANLEGPLFSLADRTGGTAIFNSNVPVERLNRVGDQMNQGYALGFEPSHPIDGRVHKLKVELVAPRRGVEVRFRKSYRDRPIDDLLVDRVVGNLMLGTGDNPLGLTAATGAPVQGKEKSFEVPIEIQIPLAMLSEIHGETGETANLRIFLTALNEEGARYLARQKTISIPLGGDEPAQVTVNMDLEVGDYWIAIGLRDEDTGLTSYLRIPATVAAKVAA